jgi:ligand-binding sensor domain-containing protein
MTNSRIRISTLIMLLVLSLLAPNRSKAETTGSDFINITYLNGLTTNSIYDICTDKSGCLWIGTATGLSKYNGYNVQNFFKEEMYMPRYAFLSNSQDFDRNAIFLTQI